MTDVVIASAARTPVGAFNGGLSTLAAHELGRIAIDGQMLGRVPDEGRAKLPHADILGRGELLSDAACGAWGRRIGIGGIALHHQHRSPELHPTLEEEGDGTAHYPAADDDDVIAPHGPKSCYPAKAGSGRPRTPGRQANRLPERGAALSCSSLRPVEAVVM